MNDYFVFIAAEKANYPIGWMCTRLGVSRASYYRWTQPTGPTPTAARREVLTGHVERVYADARGKAGRDQIVHLLAGEGIKATAATVGSIMRERGLRAVRMRAWKQTTVVDPAARTSHIENHMLDAEGNRDFSSTTPGSRLVGDITYLRTGSGWLYLATVIDLHTRMVIGWSMASHMRASLVIDALLMARDHGYLNHAAGSVVFHSDRGAQYTSSEFQDWCRANRVTQSMGKVGTCWDNAVAECFFSHLKTEMYHQQSFATHLAARTAVMEYIEAWYNRRRPHSYNGGLSPVAALAAHHASHPPVAA